MNDDSEKQKKEYVHVDEDNAERPQIDARGTRFVYRGSVVSALYPVKGDKPKRKREWRVTVVPKRMYVALPQFQVRRRRRAWRDQSRKV